MTGGRQISLDPILLRMEPSAQPAPGCAMWIRLSARLPEAHEPTSSSEVGAPLADADKRIAVEINDDTAMAQLSQARGLNLEGQRTRAVGARSRPSDSVTRAGTENTANKVSARVYRASQRSGERERTECAKELNKPCGWMGSAVRSKPMFMCFFWHPEKMRRPTAR